MNRPGDPTPTRQSVLLYVVFDMKNNTYIAASVEGIKATIATKKLD